MGQQRMLSYRFQEGCGHKRQRLQIMTSRGRVVEMGQSTTSSTNTQPCPSCGVGFGECLVGAKMGGAVSKEENQIGQGCDARKKLRKKENSTYNGADINCMMSTTTGMRLSVTNKTANENQVKTAKGEGWCSELWVWFIGIMETFGEVAKRRAIQGKVGMRTGVSGCCHSRSKVP